MKQSNIFKPTLKFSQKTSVSIFVLFVYDMYIVVAVIQCLQVTVIILCKYIVSFHNSQQRRHVTVLHASQERALHTIYYCQISNIMC